MIEKNVVILRTETGNPPGVVHYVQMLTGGMKHMNGIKVRIICLDTSLIFPGFEVTEDRIITNIPYPSKSKPLRGEIYWLIEYFNAVPDLILPYSKNRKQLAWHVQGSLLIRLVDILKLSLGGHVLTHLHIIPWKLSLEYDESLFKEQCPQRLNNIFNLINENQLEKITYPLSDRIICVSYSAMKHTISAYGIHPDRVSVMHNGMGDTGITLQEKKSRIPEILFVGRISRGRGVICLPNALNKVTGRERLCKLKLIGQCTGHMSFHIREAYKQLKIGTLGAASSNELKELYTTDTIGVTPSLHEQCSYAATEVPVSGVPMIASDVDAFSEMFKNGVNALRVPLVFDKDFDLELDEEKLADAITRLIDDEALGLRLSTSAIRNYRERLTLEKMIENTINVYKQLIEQDST